MFSRIFIVCISLLVVLSAAICTSAQTKKKRPAVKKPTTTIEAPKKEIAPATQPVEVAVKRNERPSENVQPLPTMTPAAARPDPFYRYEFTQPDFINNRIVIEHDSSGKGTVAFARHGSEEMFTDPLTISVKALKIITDAFAALNFLDSNEDYQDKRDYSHMGVVQIKMSRAGKERAVTYNFTQNKNAKTLMDEYRKISNQAIWVFDITTARENQPLESPNQIKSLDGLIKRNEISDVEQMLPFLRELADDERLPLIARNHATRLIVQIEKTKK